MNRRHPEIQTAHYIVDGEPYQCIGHVMGAARTRGYTGGESTIQMRLRKGVCTWAELIKPARPVGGAAADEKRKVTRLVKDAEVAAAIAATEARRAAIAAAAHTARGEEE